jgi:hypothetical protein
VKGGPDLVEPLVPSRFARVDRALEERFRCVYDATENAGLGPLRRALPQGWREAMLHGRATHPRPQRSTRLGDLLARGARRHVPLAMTEAAVGTACKRRRSLKQWCGWADDAVLEGLEETFLEKLAKAYRKGNPRRPAAQVSADITELRHLVSEARVEAGLPALRRRPRKGYRKLPDNRRARRPVADVDDLMRVVETALTTLPDRRRRGGQKKKWAWVAAALVLQLVLPLRPKDILGLRRRDIEGARVILDRKRSHVRRAPGPPPPHETSLHVSLALPGWTKNVLDAAIPGWRVLPGDALLFESPRKRGTVRKDLDRTLRALVERAVVPGEVTMSSVRRAGQSAHRALHAPRAVVRGTPAARFDGAQIVGRWEDREVAQAQARHAEVVARVWTSPARLPGRGPRRIPARAPSGRAPWEPEWIPPEAREAPGIPDDLAELLRPGTVGTGMKRGPAPMHGGLVPPTTSAYPWAEWCEVAVSEDVRGEQGSFARGPPSYLGPSVGGGGSTMEAQNRTGDLLAAGTIGALGGFVVGLDVGANDVSREFVGRAVHGVVSVLAQMGTSGGTG